MRYFILCAVEVPFCAQKVKFVAIDITAVTCNAASHSF
jgi:hypothetical protein